MAPPDTEPARVQRSGFETDDMDVLTAFVEQSYNVRMTLPRPVHGSLFRHRLASAGPIALNRGRHNLTLDFSWPPTGYLFVNRLDQGEMGRDIGRTAERFGPGDWFLWSDPTRSAQVHFRPMAATSIVLELPLVYDAARRSPDDVPPPIRFPSYRPISRPLADRWQRTVDYAIEVLANDDYDDAPLVINSMARMVATALLSTFPSNLIAPPVPMDRNDSSTQALRRAIAFIDENAHADISVLDIAAAAHTTRPAIERAFRRLTGMTALAHLRRVRLDRAHRDLLAAEPGVATVAGIARRWGFARPNHFARTYRLSYGVTPSQTLAR